MASHRKRTRRPVQLPLPLPGLAREPGAKKRGRKPGKRGFVRHRMRGPHAAAHPVHVVLRSRFRPLRSQFVFATVRQALAAATRARPGFRITQFSVQHDHLHLIVEASGKTELSRGMQGLAIRIARQVNRLLFRRGKLWADRFFSRALNSPRAVKHALGYVLNNFRKHGKPSLRIDPYSSAPFFDGFRELRGNPAWDLPPTPGLPLTPLGVPPPHFSDELPIRAARTWLGRIGWRRSGLISLSHTHA